MRRIRVYSAGLIIFAASLFPQQGQAADPKLSLGEDATIRIPFGSTEGVTQVMMKAENLTDNVVVPVKEPELKDLGGAGSSPATTIEFKNAVVVHAGTTSRAWLWTASIKGFPANSSQKRSARLAFGKVEQYVEYTVTNLSPEKFTWSVAAPGAPWLVWFGYPNTQRATTVVITTGDYPASNLRLAQSTLRDGLGISQIALEDLELCESVTGKSGNFSVTAHSNRTFYLRLKEKCFQWFGQNGKYNGTLSFAVNERPELQTVNVTLQASSLVAKLAGSGLILIGIVVSWWASVWARARMLRLEALKPVAALQESITSLRDDLGDIQERIRMNIPGDKEKSIQTQLDKIDKSLSQEALDASDLLPPAIPKPWPGNPDSSAKLKEHLTRQGDWVAGIAVLVRDGMKKVVAEWEDANKHEAIKTALQTLNEISNSATDRAKGEDAVRTALVQYNTHLDRSFDPSVARVFAPPTTRHLNWEIAQLYTKGWLIWGILTWLAGLAVLILTNPGFGSLLDLVFCVFWGFGLPAGIDKLQQLGPSGIATTIGVTLPKANQ